MESNEKTYVFSEKALDSYVKTVQKIARMEEREEIAKWLDMNCEEQFLADRVRAGDYK
jgi:hypothetical protein